MKCAVGLCGHCQYGPSSSARTGRSSASTASASVLRARGLSDAERKRPKLAVWKFSSCDGCQLRLLDCEDELLAVAGAVDIAYFREATSRSSKGPYDLSLVEGSITTPHDAERIREVRRRSRHLVTIGACATAGGIQALRNFRDVKELTSLVYARPEYIDSLATLDGHRRPRAGRLRAARLPAEQAPAARGGERLPARPQAEHRRPQRVRRVQAARQRLRDGGAARPAWARSRTRAAARSARATPAAATAASGRWRRRTRLAGRAFARSGVSSADLVRVFRTFNANAPAFREESAEA